MKSRVLTSIAILLTAITFATPATSSDTLRPPDLERCGDNACPDRPLRVSAELFPGVSFGELVYALELGATPRASRRSGGKIRLFAPGYEARRSARRKHVTGRNNLLRIRLF